jgi:hypothetical protein
MYPGVFYAQVPAEVKKGTRPEIPTDCPETMAELIVW